MKVTDNNNKLNIALISPIENAYSETFINAHKNKLNGNIFYLFNGELPRNSEDKDLSIKYTIINRARRKLNKTLFSNQLNFHERKIINYLKRKNINVIFCEYGTTASAMLKIVKKTKIPLVVHFHGADAYIKDIVSIEKNNYLKVFKEAFCVIAVSENMKQQLIKLECPAEKITINTYGPSNDFFSLKPDYNSNNFLAVGRFVEKKAPQNTIKAFNLVLKKYPFASLKMAGTGYLLEECKQLVLDLGIAKNVIFLGIKSPREIQQLYASSFCFVQHSVTALNGDAEGTPVAILEACAGALPVVSTYHTGIAELIIHEHTGLLSAEHDVSAMADNMCKILNDRSLALRLGTAGKQRVKEFFSIEKHIDTLNNIIKKAAESHN